VVLCLGAAGTRQRQRQRQQGSNVLDRRIAEPGFVCCEAGGESNQERKNWKEAVLYQKKNVGTRLG
jgi:hypothetical protein